MTNQTLLLVLNLATTDAEVQTFAARAAEQDARLICLVLGMMPSPPVSTIGALPYGSIDVPANWIEDLNATRKMLKERSDALETLLQNEGASGDVHTMLCNLADVRGLVARRAMVCDQATVSQNLRDDDVSVFQAVVYGTLFDAPAPLVLNAPPLPQPKRVFTAWNTELPAARAVHAALPMLKGADEVVVASFDPDATEFRDGEDPGSDLAKWLSHHGCKVTLNQYPTGGNDVASCIRRRAIEAGADLVVMGAFGRSRLRELVFGGTTQSMLDQSDTPVLMAH